MFPIGRCGTGCMLHGNNIRPFNQPDESRTRFLGPLVTMFSLYEQLILLKSSPRSRRPSLGDPSQEEQFRKYDTSSSKYLYELPGSVQQSQFNLSEARGCFKLFCRFVVAFF